MNDSPPPRSPRDTDDDQEATHYVLPMVVRLERSAPPTRTDALETAARAVLTLLSDERVAGGEWEKPVRLWEERGIRKVVRRARGAEWRRAEALDGITVHGGTAQVRVFPPVPLDGWPKDLARLQVSGTELSDPQPPETPAGPLSATNGGATPLLWLNPELEMSAGKAMAQAAHAAQLAWWDLDAGARAEWRNAGFPLAVRTAPDVRAWRRLVDSGLPVVRDAGYTEIAPGSSTVVAEHPASARPPRA